MKTWLKTAATAAAIMVAATCVTAETTAKALRVLIDVGPAGSPFRHAGYADHTGRIVANLVDQLGLKDGDLLEIKTVGNPSLMDHLDLTDLNLRVPLAYRGARAEDVGSYLSEQINGLKDVKAHDSSDLMATLRHLSRDSLCDSHTVTTIVLTNGIQVGTIEGPRFTLHNPPAGSPFCGQLTYVGLWVDDAQPVPGLQISAEKLFLDLATQIGFDHADILR